MTRSSIKPGTASVDFVRRHLLFEDNHLLAVVKPFNMPSQGDVSKDPSIFEHVREYLRLVWQKPGNVYLALLHRLDRPAGGIMVFGKTGKAAGRMGRMFQDKTVTKQYFAIVTKRPTASSGELHHYLKKTPGTNVVKAYTEPGSGRKEAWLKYRLLEESQAYFLLHVSPLTGRPHQIRVQLSEHLMPIAGDLKYGAPKPAIDRSICLYACHIAFDHPVKDQKIILNSTPPAEHIWKNFKYSRYLTKKPGKGF